MIDRYNAKNEINWKTMKNKVGGKADYNKVYCQRFIFIVAGGQDILAEDLKFTYIEINDRLAQFVSPAIWKSEAAQKLTLNQKIEKSVPSLVLEERCMAEIIEEASEKLGEQYESAYLLDGRTAKSPRDIPI